MNIRVPITAMPDSQPYRLLIDSRVEFLSLGTSARLAQHYTTVRGRQQLGTSRHALHVGVTHDGRSVRTDEDPLLRTNAWPVADVGLELKWSQTALGNFSVLGMATLDRGPAGALVLSSGSPYHSIQLSGWRVNARSLVLTVPTDTVTDIAEQHVVHGARAEASLSIPLGAIRPSAQATYESSKALSEPVEGEAFLTMSPQGELEAARVSLGLTLHDRAGLVVRRAWQNIELGGPLVRTGLQAGELFFGRLEFRQWMANGWLETESNHWSLFVGSERLESAVSVRLETWPYVELWEQLGATAFRYRGSLAGRVLWFRLQHRGTRSKPNGLTWAVNVGRYELDTSQRDWLVTSLGFGRAEDDSVATAVRPVILLGGEVAKRFRVASGWLHLFLAADLPVYAQTEHSHDGPDPSPTDGGALAGQFRVGLFWAW
jgi:hypothetical protein